MFVTFTDWSMNNPEDGVETANAMWPQMQQVGATAFYGVKTGDQEVRTMTVWPDEATAQAAIGRLRRAGAQMAGSEVAGSAMGVVLFEKP